MSFSVIQQFVATVLEVPESDVQRDTDLVGLGLDSVRLMMTLEFLEDEGHHPDFAEFAAQPTIAAWLELLAEA